MTGAANNLSNEHVYAVVLAGGSGTRFWPKSRHLRPKQLCKLGHPDLTMLEQTLQRLDGLIPLKRRLIVTHCDQAEATRRLVKGRCDVVLAEPEARNTANALALAALHIEAVHQHSHTARTGALQPPIMISLHADALIKDEFAFRNCLLASIAVAEQGFLTLMGIVPEYPEIGYGYIERGELLKLPNLANPVFKVASFREKPPQAVAEEFVASQRFYWNAGLFCWQTKIFLQELSKRLPLCVHKLAPLAAPQSGYLHTPLINLAPVYRNLPKISVDHAVLEVSDNVAVIPAAIGWQDIGSWDALGRALATDARGNQAFGEALLLDSNNTTIDTDGPFVAALGLQDLVVVHSQGAILVCPKNRAQDVKLIVEWLKEHGKNNLV